MRFKVKIDLWLRLFLYSIIVFYFVLSFLVPKQDILIIILIAIGMALLILPFMHLSYYELGETELLIKFAFIRVKIEYQNIINVKKGKFTLKKSFSFSMRNVLIIIQTKSFKLRSIYVSPLNRDMFISELSKRCINVLSDSEIEY